EAVVAGLPDHLQDFARFAYLSAWRKGQIASLTWGDVDRDARTILARAENVKNGRAHKLVLEGELGEIIERRWSDREYETDDGTGVSKYVFHRDGKPIREFRKSWARACYDADLPCELVYKKRLQGEDRVSQGRAQQGGAGHREDYL